ncbi:minor capsid protein [Moraxella haemolytica]|uniref:minor capsid protein n=1 Tax=Moraxella haemolytica TaxID=2904119 RepID=UPI0025427CD8|nr:minor capsid protein [Moraxella sp. ZY171148]WII95981.1 minor capsid protein [Moraxella sp. ZY171148]
MKSLINLERLKTKLTDEFGIILKAVDAYLQKAIFNHEVKSLNAREIKQLTTNADRELQGLFGAYVDGLKANWRGLFSHRYKVQNDEAYKVFKKRLNTPKSLMAYADKVFDKPLHLTTNVGISLDELTKSFGENESERIIRAIRLAHSESLDNAKLIQMIRGSRANRYQDGILNISTRHAKTLAHTGTAIMASEAKQAFINDNKDIIKGIKVIATLDRRTSPICRHLDGQFMPLDKAVYPPYHFNCRSSFEIVHDGYTKPNNRASEFGVTENVSYYEWLKGQDKAYIQSVLGKRNAEIFLSDGMSADKFKRLGFDRVFMPMGLDELLNLETPPVKALYQKMKAAEPNITQDMTAIVKQVGVVLSGLEHRLKSQGSLQRKVASEVLQGKELDSVLPNIKDVIRYTVLLDEKSFVKQYQSLLDELEQAGYNVVRVKNTWKQGAMYKGINTFVEKDGVVFELQYHTQDSFALKNGKLHTLYEEFRLDDTSEARRAVLFFEMQSLSDKIRQPPNIDKIDDKK